MASLIIPLALLGPALLLGWLAHYVATRSDIGALLVAAIVLIGAWYVLISAGVVARRGPGVGSAVFQAAGVYVGGVCVLVAAVALVTSYRARRSALMRTVLIFAFIPYLFVLGYRLGSGAPAGAAAPGGPAGGAPPRSTYTEGYVWAMDNGLASPDACTNGAPAFIDGCRAAAQKLHDAH